MSKGTSRGLRYRSEADLPEGMRKLLNASQGREAHLQAQVLPGASIELPARPKRHADHRAGEMNKTEARYAQHLEGLKVAGQVDWWGFEVMKVRLAKRAWFTVDFTVRFPDGRVELHEVKGRKGERYWAEEDAKLKAKFAAEQYPFWPLRIVWPRKGGGWMEELL